MEYDQRTKYRLQRAQITQPEDDSYRLIPLTRGQVAIVDTADYGWLNQWNWGAQWHANTSGFYVVRKAVINGKAILLHMGRVIMNAPQGLAVDHVNHQTTDNRRENLRLATSSQNMANRRRYKNNKSGFKGVYFDQREQVWIAGIGVNGKHLRLGRFDNPQVAGEAYRRAALEFHGEFACFADVA